VKLLNKLWINTVILLLYFIFPECFAQVKSIKTEDTRSSLLKVYEGIELALDGYWEKAVLKFRKAIEDNSQNKIAYHCNILISDIIDDKVSEKTGADFFRAIDAWIFSNNLKAKKIFKSLEDTQKEYGLLYLFKGMNEETLELYEDAFIDYQRVIQLEPKVSYTFIKRGVLYARQRRYDKALGDFDHAIKLDSMYYAGYYEKGIVYQALEKYEESIENYERAYYLYPPLKQTLHESLKICEGYNNLGMFYLKNNKVSEALQNFNDAIAWNSNFHEPFLNRGITFRNLQFYDAALSDFKKVLELDTAEVEVYYNTALVYKEMGDYDKTIFYLSKIIDTDPTYTQSYHILGEVYYEQRQFDLATQMFEKVVTIDNKDYWGYYWLALSFDAIRKYPQAIEAYEVFIKIAPEEYYDQKIKMYERAERLRRWIEKKNP
jgi:tetratricopeptide (TPR) repeat protein